jgi:hypothetical protein
MLMAMRRLQDNPAAHDAVIKFIQFLGLLPDFRFNCSGYFNIAARNLQRDFHYTSLLIQKKNFK